LSLIGLDVLLNNFELFLSSSKLSLSLFLNLSLLADLGIDVSLVLSNFLDLSVKFLLLLESLNLSFDDGLLVFSFGDIFFLGGDNYLRDSDLLFDMLLISLSLPEFLAGVGQLSSSSGLLSDSFLSGGDKGFDFLSVINDGRGDLVNIFLDLGLLSNRDNLNLLLKVLLLLNKSSGS
jgi:hypothetical protein